MKTIREKLTVAMALPLALIVLFCGYKAVEAIEKRVALSEAEEYAHTITLLLQAAGHQAVERGITNAALNGTEPVSARRLALLTERREKGGAALDEAMERLRSHDFEGKEQAYAQLQQRLAIMNTLRAYADKQMRLAHKDKRDPRLLQTWVPGMSALVVSGQHIRYLLTGNIEQRFAGLSRNARMMHFSWMSSEFAGRERAIIGAMLSSNTKPTPKTLMTLADYRGRVETGFDITDKLMVGASEQVQSVFADAVKTYLNTFQSVREHIYTAAMSHDTYPMTAAEWIKASTAAIDTILAVQQTLVSDTGVMITELNDAANMKVVISLLLLIAAGYSMLVGHRFVKHNISEPLDIITHNLKQIAAGDLNNTTGFVGRKDEIGAIADAAEIFRASALENRKLNDDAKRHQAEEKEHALRRVREKEKQRVREQELKAQAEEERRVMRNALAEDFEERAGSIIASFRESVLLLSGTAADMLCLAEQSAVQTEGAATDSTSTSGNISAIAASAEELSAAQRHVSEQIRKADDLVKVTAERTDRAHQYASALSQASTKVESVINLIADISRQTNLLAINAAVEAARAGAAGSGFAVVAGEVKRLAEQTDRSIEDISVIIKDMNSASENIVDSLSQVRSSTADISEVSAMIASAAEEQTAGTDSVTDNITMVTGKTQAVSDRLRIVSEAAARTGRSAAGVSEAAVGLERMSDNLHDEIQRFIKDVRG